MKYAIKEAIYAFHKNEVPVGAIIVYKKKIISKGHNLTCKLLDITAHAEIQVIKKASIYLQDKYLNNCTLYVTLEPCIMCAGALFWCKINKLVFGAFDKKQGFLNYKIKLHPKTRIISGILKNKCESLLKNFFKEKRNNIL